jgi:hypothetical protein
MKSALQIAPLLQSPRIAIPPKRFSMIGVTILVGPCPSGLQLPYSCVRLKAFPSHLTELKEGIRFQERKDADIGRRAIRTHKIRGRPTQVMSYICRSNQILQNNGGYTDLSCIRRYGTLLSQEVGHRCILDLACMQLAREICAVSRK